jgi:uncharacterized protein with ParB-like and HNH nuclease domain
MKATEANLLKFLRKSPQFVIPIYQHNYSWTSDECKQLWHDLMRAGRDDKVPAHLIGSIVYVERSLSTVTNQELLLVIDAIKVGSLGPVAGRNNGGDIWLDN